MMSKVLLWSSVKLKIDTKQNEGERGSSLCFDIWLLRRMTTVPPPPRSIPVVPSMTSLLRSHCLEREFLKSAALKGVAPFEPLRGLKREMCCRNAGQKQCTPTHTIWGNWPPRSQTPLKRGYCNKEKSGNKFFNLFSVSAYPYAAMVMAFFRRCKEVGHEGNGPIDLQRRGQLKCATFDKHYMGTLRLCELHSWQ